MDVNNIIKNSFSINDASIKIYGYTNGRTIKKIYELISDNSLDVSHLGMGKKNRKYKIIIKICPICDNEFETLEGHKNEKTTCSGSCSNKYFQHGQNNPNFDEENYIKRYNKVSNTLKGKTTIDGERVDKPKKYCLVCNEDITNKPKKQKYCSVECVIADGVSDSTKKKQSDSMKKRVELGNHSGWISRNIESYPEKFFKEVLNNNGIDFEFNKKIRKSDLGLDCHSNYFLDFYISSKKIDLEIDGKQHNFPDRVESDKLRDESLIKNGFKVYRIKWKSINSDNGKKYIKKEIGKFLEFYKTT